VAVGSGVNVGGRGEGYNVYVGSGSRVANGSWVGSGGTAVYVGNGSGDGGGSTGAGVQENANTSKIIEPKNNLVFMVKLLCK